MERWGGFNKRMALMEGMELPSRVGWVCLKSKMLERKVCDYGVERKLGWMKPVLCEQWLYLWFEPRSFFFTTAKTLMCIVNCFLFSQSVLSQHCVCSPF